MLPGIMQIASQILDIETRLKAQRITLGVVLTEAGIDRSTWTRWRSGATRPRLDTWMAAQAAAQRLLDLRKAV